MKAYINGAAAFLPNAPVANADIEKVLGMVGSRPSVARTHVLKANGIQSRHYAIDPLTGKATHTNAQMTAEAVRQLSARAGLSLEELALLSCGTATPDQLLPAHGSMVHGELACPPCEVVTCAGVCCSSMAALKYAAMAVACGEAANAVVTGSELTSSSMRASHFQPELEEKAKKLASQPHLAFEHDFLRWMLSDGAGAFLLEPEPRRRGADATAPLRIEWIDYVSFAGEMEACMYHGAIKDGPRLVGWKDVEDPRELLRSGFFNIGQDARLLNKNIGRLMGEGLKRSIDKHRLEPGQISWVLPHFSSYYFQPEMEKKLQELGFDIPGERVFTNLARKGNIGAASIFVIVDELLSTGRLREGERLLCFVPESGRFSVSYMLLTVCG
ncbi:MAG: beta-ketoacyl-ACP synthase III [Deltaproteobacteria bacterium]|nr:beta-ketoacyl-ACP synthase III [Deltaproteobacteria bacterium]